MTDKDSGSVKSVSHKERFSGSQNKRMRRFIRFWLNNYRSWFTTAIPTLQTSLMIGVKSASASLLYFMPQLANLHPTAEAFSYSCTQAKALAHVLHSAFSLKVSTSVSSFSMEESSWLWSLFEGLRIFSLFGPKSIRFNREIDWFFFWSSEINERKVRRRRSISFKSSGLSDPNPIVWAKLLFLLYRSLKFHRALTRWRETLLKLTKRSTSNHTFFLLVTPLCRKDTENWFIKYANQ